MRGIYANMEIRWNKLSDTVTRRVSETPVFVHSLFIEKKTIYLGWRKMQASMSEIYNIELS